MTRPADDTPPAGGELLAGDPAPALAALLARLPGFAPEWRPAPGGDWAAAHGPGAALARIAARYLEVLGQRVPQAAAKRELAFLGALGLELQPASPARAPVAFRLQDKAPAGRVPAGTRLVADPPPGAGQPVAFETDATVGVSAAKLVEVRSFWPGRDQYIDHTAAALAGQPFAPFRRRDLTDTPHELYLAHGTLLALAGKVSLLVGIELATPGTRPLQILWEYWDGEVWRSFRDVTSACAESAAAARDGTDGLTKNGPILLEADFAESGRRAVNGYDSFWVRARVTTPLPAGLAPDAPALPPDPAATGPEPARPCDADDPTARYETGPAAATAGATAGGGRILPRIDVVELSLQLQRPLPPPPPPAKKAAPADGDADPAVGLAGKQVPDKGLPPEKAFADHLALDVTKTFAPFGPHPTPGNAFYLAADEVMTKPGAVVTLRFLPAATTHRESIKALEVTTAGPTIKEKSDLPLKLAWEYWDGRRWSDLVARRLDDTKPERSLFVQYDDPAEPRDVQFRVPADAAPKQVNNVEARWVRVRIVSGGFGIVYKITHTPPVQPTPPAQVTATVIPDAPALEDVRVGYVWQYGPYPPEKVFAYNDFAYEDQTAAAYWDGATFQPFRPPAESTPALYLGFDQPLAAESTGVYFDVTERPGDDLGPPLVWEFWDGFGWVELLAEDRTRGLRVPGLVRLLNVPGSVPRARFGTARHWLRGRLKDDGPPGEPALLGVYPHAVGCAQQETVTNEPMGAADGRPDLTLRFTRVPVLAGEEVEVCEVSGGRAAVEWRVIARELGGERYVRELEAQLAAEGAATDAVAGPVRVRRDRLKRATEVWVRWGGRPHLLDSGPGDRHYVVGRARGVLRFGDGRTGKVPPAGAAVRAVTYRVGGGAFGNVPAGAIKQVVGAIGGLQQVTNVRPAEGGADGETVDRARGRGPAFVRHGGRAVLPADYEALAVESSPAVARAWALSNRDAAGRAAPQPGGVTVVVIPYGTDPAPWPSFGLREEVRKYLAAACPAAIAADGLRVTGPVYHPVGVAAAVAPRVATEAGPVLARVRAALQTFLHPVHGGADGAGWPPGRPVYATEVAAAVERVEGVDHVASLTLTADGAPQPDVVPVPAGRVVAAGPVDLRPAATGVGAEGGAR